MYPVCCIFETEQEAIDANAIITQNMNCNNWALIFPKTDGRYFFQKPEDRYMEGVGEHKEAVFDSNWRINEDG